MNPPITTQGGQSEANMTDMTEAEFFAGIRETLAQALANPQAHAEEHAFADQAFEDGLDAFFESIDRLHPGLFEPAQDSEDGERFRQAFPNDPRSQPNIVVSSSMGEITVGMGSFAHTHFHIDQADQALHLVSCLARGETGCLEAIRRDGSIQWGRFVSAVELDQAGGPPLSTFEHLACARFFGGQRDIDFFNY